VAQRGEIVVIGGGIAGAFAALNLAELGAGVVLVERDGIGSQASGNNPGGLKPLHGAGIPGPLGELALEAFQLHLDAWERVRELSGIDFSPRRHPRLHLGKDERDFEDLAQLKQTFDGAESFSASWLGREELVSVVPDLDPAFERGLWTEGTGKVDPGAYTRAVAAAAVRLSARIVTGEVRGLAFRGERVTAVALESETVGCDGVVVATGPWSAGPAEWLHTPLPVEPLKGEMLLAEDPRDGERVDLVWRDAQVYEAGPGQVWLAGTEERVGFDRTPSDAGRAEILDKVAVFDSELGGARVLRQTAGLRPVTPDNLPIAGPANGWENVAVAMGAGRKGMLLSAALGRAAAELLVRGSTELPIENCSPERFVAEAVA
jgi:glycine/D-amino acid oxidase-like deaminating enzyme